MWLLVSSVICSAVQNERCVDVDDFVGRSPSWAADGERFDEKRLMSVPSLSAVAVAVQ